MRAQTVNFERGGDPKTTLRIGKVRDVEELREEYDRIHVSVQLTPYLDLQEDFANEVSDLIPSRLFGNHGWGNIHLSFNQLTREELYDFDKLIEKYSRKIEELKESVNFERGADPKKSMNIGLGEDKLEVLKALKELKELGINADSEISEEGLFELNIPELEDHQVAYLPEAVKNATWDPEDSWGWGIYDLDDGELVIDGKSWEETLKVIKELLV